MLKYNGLLGLILSQNSTQIIAKTSTSLQISVSDMLTHVLTSLYFLYGGPLLWRADTKLNTYTDKLRDINTVNICDY